MRVAVVVSEGDEPSQPSGKGQEYRPKPHNREEKGLSGDPGWIRTIDLPLRRRPLYPLSYGASAPP